jgi:hypothetical protein
VEGLLTSHSAVQNGIAQLVQRVGCFDEVFKIAGHRDGIRLATFFCRGTLKLQGARRPMNGKKIREAKGKHVRIRPISLRFDMGWNALPQIDDNWFVHEAGRDGATIENPRTDHKLTLGADQIHDFRTDPSGRSFGFLNLNGQAWLRGNEAGVEPLPYHAGLRWTPTPPPAPPARALPQLMPPSSALSMFVFGGLLLWAIADW